MASSCGRRTTASSSMRSGSQSKLESSSSQSKLLADGGENDEWSPSKKVCVAFGFLMALWVSAYGISALFIEALIRVSA